MAFLGELWSFRVGFFSKIESSDSEDGFSVGFSSVLGLLLRECVLVGCSFFLSVLRGDGLVSGGDFSFPWGGSEPKMDVCVPLFGVVEGLKGVVIVASEFAACVVGGNVFVAVLGVFKEVLLIIGVEEAVKW